MREAALNRGQTAANDPRNCYQTAPKQRHRARLWNNSATRELVCVPGLGRQVANPPAAVSEPNVDSKTGKRNVTPGKREKDSAVGATSIRSRRTESGTVSATLNAGVKGPETIGFNGRGGAPCLVDSGKGRNSSRAVVEELVDPHGGTA